jgi:TetR/AcrR family transcriptional repressor of nem operon
MPIEATHRDRLLEAARRLMLMKGYPATKVDEICTAAGVTKGSFYHHFSSKDDLAIATLEHFFIDLTSQITDGNWTKTEDPVQRIMALIDHLIDVAKGPFLEHGCLLGTLTLDLAETNPRMREILQEKFNRLITAVEPHMQTALDQSQRHPIISAASLAQQLVAVLEGAIILGKASADRDTIAQNLFSFRTMLSVILSSPEVVA